MGLDMMLYGRKTVWNNSEMEDGFPLSSKTFDIEYWRKHSNLHGFIVDTFNAGKDDCNEIYLSVEDMKIIIKAIEEDALPFTDGLFFGRSPDINSSNHEEKVYAMELKKYSIEAFKKAIAWVEATPENEYRGVIYQASW